MEAITHKPVKKKRSCFICGRASSKKFCMDHQWQEKREGPRHVCPLCSKVFTESGNLKRHKRLHDKETPGVGVVREHCYSLTDSATKPFLCDICGQTFTARVSLLRHQQKLHGYTLAPESKVEVVSYDCDGCGKSFKKRSVMSRHFIRMHSTERPLKCSFCEKTFAQTCDLVRHERVHKKEKMFICDTCGRRFLRKHHLQDHILTHSRTRSFLCNGCGQSYMRKGNFENHKISCSLITGPGPSHAPMLDQQKNGTRTAQDGLETSVVDQASDLASNQKPTGVGQPEEQTSGPDTLSEAIMQTLGMDYSVFEKVTTNGKRYICDFCNKECTSMHELFRHRRMHTKERPFVCNICGKRFKQTGHLATHKVTHTKEKAFKCKICNRDFSLRNSFVRHCKKMHGVFPRKRRNKKDQEPSTPQETSSDTTQQENQLGDNDEPAQEEAGSSSLDLFNQPPYIYFQHEDQVGGNPTLHTEAATALVDFLTQASEWSAILESNPSTAACNTTMETSAPDEPTDYSSFRKILPDGVRYVCNFCDKPFAKKFDLIRHRRIHLKQKPFACDTCGKRFTQKRHLRDHLPTHTKIKSFICGKCGKAFAHDASLRYHRKRNCTPALESESSQPQPIDGCYSCDHCDKTFSQRYRLERHTLTHTSKGKPFVCKVCGKRFAQREHVRKHCNIHTLQATAHKRNYICETCGRCFISKKGLTLHKKSHTDEDRWYVCNICGKGFVEKKSLNDHQRTHAGKKVKERRFKCSTCGKAYFYKQSLTKHLNKKNCSGSEMNKQSTKPITSRLQQVQDTVELYAVDDADMPS